MAFHFCQSGISGGQPSGRHFPNNLLLFLFRLQIKRSRVHAITQPGRRWTVFKHMPQMRSALGTTSLGPGHPETAVFVLFNFASSAGLKKLGHPVPESNFVDESNNGSPQQTQ